MVKSFCKRCDMNQPEGFVGQRCYFCGKALAVMEEKAPETLRAVPPIAPPVTRTCVEDECDGSECDPGPPSWDGTY